MGRKENVALALMWSVVIIFFIYAVAITAFPSYTIEGDTVFINDSNAYISATPHTMMSSGWVEIKLVSKQFTGDIDVAFGFDSAAALPEKPQLYDPYFYNVTRSFTCGPPYWFNYTTDPKYAWCWETRAVSNDTNETVTELVFGHSFVAADLPSGTIYWSEERFNEWTGISGLFTKVAYDYDGKDAWYVARDIPVVAGETYKVRFLLDARMNTAGKYGVAVKPSSLTLAEAVQQGKFYYLDPWWNTTMTRWPLVQLNNESNPFLVNDTYGIDIGGGIQYIWCENATNYIYNDTNGNVYCANGTTQVGTFIDEGNGTNFGNMPSDIVLFLDMGAKNCNATQCNDQSIHGKTYPKSASGEPKLNTTDCKVGSCQEFDGTDDRLTLDDDAFWNAAFPDSGPFYMAGWFLVNPDTGNWIIGRDGHFIFNVDTNGKPTFYFWYQFAAGGRRVIPTGSNGDITFGQLHFIEFSHTGTGNQGTIYIDTVNVTVTQPTSTNAKQGTDTMRIGNYVANYANVVLDTLILMNRTPTDAEREAIYNNTRPDGYSTVGAMETFSAGVTNTSIKGVNFNISDFTLASTTYVTGLQADFNSTGSDTNFTLLSSMNIEKLPNGGTNMVSVRIKINGAVVLEEVMRTVTGADDEGAAITTPLIFNVSSGQHNITYDFKRTGTGSVSINDVDVVLIQFETNASNALRGEITSAVYDHTSTAFTTAFNWTINKTINASTYVAVKQTINKSGSGSATVEYYVNNLETGDTSPLWRRWLQNDTDTGSIGGTWFNDANLGQHNYSLQSKQSDAGETVSVNGTILDFDMIDNSSNTVQNFQVTNTSTNSTLSQNYTAGTHLLVNKTVTVVDGDSYFLSMHTSFGTTSGNQTPTYKINATETGETNCTSKKDRYLNSSSDIGNVVIYTICSNLTVGSSYTFNLWLTVPSGETVTQMDESFNGFEVTELSIVVGNTAPIVAIISPNNGSSVSGDVNINWTTAEQQGDSYTTNVSLSNATATVSEIATDRPDSVSNHTWDSTAVVAGDYNLTVESCENATGDLLCGNDTILITVPDQDAPDIVIHLPLNQTYSSIVGMTLNYSVDEVTDWTVLEFDWTDNVTAQPQTSECYNITGLNNSELNLSGDDEVQQYDVDKIVLDPTTGNDYAYITQVSFRLYKDAGASGNVTFKIYENTLGGELSLLVSKVWGNASALGTSADWVSLKLDTPLNVTKRSRAITVGVHYNGSTSIRFEWSNMFFAEDDVCTGKGEYQIGGTSYTSDNLYHRIHYVGANVSISPAQGRRQIIVYANDTAGNLNSSSVEFYIDSVPPTVTDFSQTPSTCVPNPGVVRMAWFQEDNLDDLTVYCNFTNPSDAVTKVTADSGNSTVSSCSKLMTDVGQWQFVMFLEDFANNSFTYTGAIDVRTTCQGEAGTGGGSPLTHPVEFIKQFLLPCEEGFEFNVFEGRCQLSVIPEGVTPEQLAAFEFFRPRLIQVTFDETFTDESGATVEVKHSVFLFSIFQVLVTGAGITTFWWMGRRKFGQFKDSDWRLLRYTLALSLVVFNAVVISTAIPAEVAGAVAGRAVFEPAGQIFTPAEPGPEVGFEPPPSPFVQTVTGAGEFMAANPAFGAFIVLAVVGLTIAALALRQTDFEKRLKESLR